MIPPVVPISPQAFCLSVPASALSIRCVQGTTVLIATQKGTSLYNRLQRTPNGYQRRSFWWGRSQNCSSYMNRQAEARNYIEARHKVLKHRCGNFLRRRSHWGQDDNPKSWKIASSWGLPKDGVEERKPEGVDYWTKQTQIKVERLRRMQEMRKRIEEDPFEALFGRSVMRLHGDHRLTNWARTLLNGWRFSSWNHFLGERDPKGEPSWPSKQQQPEFQQSQPPQKGKGPKKEETQSSKEEFEFDPITMRRVPRKTRTSDTLVNDAVSVSKNSTEPQRTLSSRSQAMDKTKSDKVIHLPVKPFAGFQREPVIYIPEAKTKDATPEDNPNTIQPRQHTSNEKDMSQSQRAMYFSEKYPANQKIEKPEDFESSWENVQAGITKRKMQYEQMASKNKETSKSTTDSNGSSWLNREGFAAKATTLEIEEVPVPSISESTKYSYRPKPRYQLLDESNQVESTLSRPKEHRPSTGQLKGKPLETAAERLRQRTETNSDSESHGIEKAAAVDVAKATRQRESLEPRVEHHRQDTEGRIDHAQQVVANLQEEMPESKSSSAKEVEPKINEAAVTEGEGDLCRNVSEYAERSPLFNPSPATFQERAETEKRAWAKHHQKIKDQALVREIRGIYEDEYGIINTKHRQTHTKESQLSAKAPTETEEPNVSPSIEPQKLIDSAVKEAPALAVPEPVTYKILAYDPQSQEISSAITKSSSQFHIDASVSERIISVPEVLLGINSPARFLPYFAKIQAEGYELIRGSGDVVVFKKVRDTTAAPASKVYEGPPPAYSHRDMNPIDGTTTGNYASPTGFVNHDVIMPPNFEGEVGNSTKAPSGSARVTRQEPVFSGGQKWQEPNQTQGKKEQGTVRKVVRRVVWGAIWVGACSYAVGVVIEFFTTGGSDGLGAVGF